MLCDLKFPDVLGVRLGVSIEDEDALVVACVVAGERGPSTRQPSATGPLPGRPAPAAGRRYRPIGIQAGARTITAADPLPDDLRQAFEAIARAR